MKYSEFNDCKISRLGFGTMRLPMHPDGTIDYEAGKEMVDYALDNGITYFDTAYKYHEGEAEIFCREALTAFATTICHCKAWQGQCRALRNLSDIHRLHCENRL